jgi:Domain of unknown function (DUF4189)
MASAKVETGLPTVRSNTGRSLSERKSLVLRKLLLAALAAGPMLLARTDPAFAAYGAFALDDGAHKYGYSWNKESAKEADEAALKGCATDKCKVVFRTGPKQCGAIALGADEKAWGGAQRNTKDAAELAAMKNCQEHTSGQCKVRASECNK